MAIQSLTSTAAWLNRFLYGTPDEIYAAMGRKLKQLDQKIQEMKNLEAIVKKALMKSRNSF